MEHDQLRWHGETVVDSQGHKIGKVDEIYVDIQTGRPEWALVNTGLFGTSSSFVPLAQASPTDDGIVVPYDKDLVKDAPQMDGDRQLTPEEEGTLYRHYGMQQDASATGTPTQGHDTSGPTTDDAMTRSEEEVRVGTQTRETGRARLRKHVVTEHVTETVPVSREEAHVVREPITDANVDPALDGPALSEEEHEVILTEEVPVVDKQTVPKERVRLETDRVADEVRVEEDVRREVIDVDEDASSRR